MLNTYNNQSQAILTNGAISFAANKNQSGCSTVHSPGSTTISLKCPGTYLILFNGTMASTADTETLPVTISLFNNGTAVNGATASGLSATSTSVISLEFSTIIQVRPSCCATNNIAELTVVNTGVPATYSNVNLVAIKVDC